MPDFSQVFVGLGHLGTSTYWITFGAAVLIAAAAGVIPGLSAPLLMALAIPFVVFTIDDPVVGIVFLATITGVEEMLDVLPIIAMGHPGGGQVTFIEGRPLSQRGPGRKSARFRVRRFGHRGRRGRGRPAARHARPQTLHPLVRVRRDRGDGAVRRGPCRSPQQGRDGEGTSRRAAGHPAVHGRHRPVHRDRPLHARLAPTRLRAAAHRHDGGAVRPARDDGPHDDPAGAGVVERRAERPGGVRGRRPGAQQDAAHHPALDTRRDDGRHTGRGFAGGLVALVRRRDSAEQGQEPVRQGLVRRPRLLRIRAELEGRRAGDPDAGDGHPRRFQLGVRPRGDAGLRHLSRPAHAHALRGHHHPHRGEPRARQRGAGRHRAARLRSAGEAEPHPVPAARRRHHPARVPVILPGHAPLAGHPPSCWGSRWSGC